MYHISYYRELSGYEPVAEWLDELHKANKKTSAQVHDKIAQLQKNGLVLLNTKMLDPIRGYGGDFYELKHGKYRIALYHDTARSKFILLHGFTKKRKREPREIKTAYSRLCEYQSRR